jgi:alkane 1-monooxygenase
MMRENMPRDGQAGREDAAAAYVDRRRLAWAAATLVPALPLAAIGLHAATGVELWLFLPMAVLYGLVPLLDRIVGEDPTNPPEAAVPALEADSYYRRLIYLGVAITWFTVVFCAWYAATAALGPLGFLGLALGAGFASGAAINMGHELGHKKRRAERIWARIALAPSGYGHFGIEHVRGHHRDVATPEDSASSRLGESYYRFIAREIPGAFRRAWALERERLRRRGAGPWSVDNEILQVAAITLALWTVLGFWLGPVMIPFALIQGAYAYSLLSSANYVEHYGLLRERGPDGRYVRPQPRHSWNSNHLISNLLLYQLQRHSDHHAHPTRRYQALRHFEEAPQLPSGYFGMFLVAFVPPLWFRVMDRRVLANAEGDLSRVNVDPSRRPPGGTTRVGVA